MARFSDMPVCLESDITAKYISYMDRTNTTLIIPGISGNVSIDENGDRNADYSLLDMDPATSKFRVSLNCSLFKLLNFVNIFNVIHV